MAISSRSTLEDRVQENLKKRGIVYTYEPCKLPYNVQRNYIPDLLIGDIYVEVKGYFRQDAQRKMKSVKEQHPELDIRFLFQRASSTVQGRSSAKTGRR